MKENRQDKPEKRNSDNKKTPFKRKERSDKKYKRRRNEGEKSFGDRRFNKDERSDKPFRKHTDKPAWKGKPSDRGDRDGKSFGDRRFNKESHREKPLRKGREDKWEKNERFEKKRFDKSEHREKGEKYSGERKKTGYANKPFKKRLNNEKPERNFRSSSKRKSVTQNTADDEMRLNKYIAHCGVCSRRDADVLIKSGAVKVNDKIVTELGVKVKMTDKVQVDDQTIKNETLRYVLLNKPKNFITTMDDPQKRNIVVSLIQNACKERLYPVGRLDRNTTGVLLLTNDGDLAKKLTHPSYKVKKIYRVELDKNVSEADLQKIREGFDIEEHFIKADDINYAEDANSKKVVGIEIHSGRNRIIRKIFEHLGYHVVKLDRVSFAGLTKKNLGRGKWRFLTDKEVIFLKNFISKK